MHCPKCGQAQVSDEVRYCSRCGFPLRGVTELLASGGTLPTLVANNNNEPNLMSPRRKGARQGGKLMLVGAFLVPILALMHAIIGLPGEFLIIGLIIFLIGLARLLYAAIFEDRTAIEVLPDQMNVVHAPPLMSQLGTSAQPRGVLSSPPPMSSVESYRPPQVNTADMAYRPSITENTTRLLEQEDSSDQNAH